MKIINISVTNLLCAPMKRLCMGSPILYTVDLPYLQVRIRQFHDMWMLVGGQFLCSYKTLPGHMMHYWANLGQGRAPKSMNQKWLTGQNYPAAQQMAQFWHGNKESYFVTCPYIFILFSMGLQNPRYGYGGRETNPQGC